MAGTENQNVLKLDAKHVREWRDSWRRLIDCCVWSDLVSSKLGALGRLRKRILDLGEILRSFSDERAWIPRIREQLKSALGTSIKLRDSISAADALILQIDGGVDREEFCRDWESFKQSILQALPEYENQWATMLDQLADVDEKADDE